MKLCLGSVKMNKLQNNEISIYEAIMNIKEGKYVMPAFQRQYVWSMEQIEKLWDSILLDYPIATFLFWHVDKNNVTNDTYFCDFLENVTFDSRKLADSINYDLLTLNFKTTDTAVLDGQQRLTSLFLSLFGDASIRQKHARKKNGEKIIAKLLVELNKNKLEVDEENYNSKKFDIKFSDKIGILSPTQFEIRNILSEKFQNKETRENAIEEAIKNVPFDSKDYAKNILNKLYNKIFVEKLIHYTEITGMNQDDALEMFVRFNSGGKALRKTEITMSILEAYWPSAKTEFGKLLVGSYSEFNTDFIIRTSLMLYGDVVKSNINKKAVEELKNNWKEFSNCLTNLDQLLKEFKIDITRFANSWNVLLPIIYLIYYNSNYKENKVGIKAYLIRAILFSYFRSGTTAKLQQMKSNINNFNYEITIEMLEQMNELRITDGKVEDIINAEKGSRIAEEALYYLSLEWINKNFKYEQDHLHPEERFANGKPSSIPIEEWKEWRNNRNRLPNLQLLEGRSNGSKNDMSLIDYYNDMNDEQKESFCKWAFIPEKESLEFNNFGNFYKSRKEILEKNLNNLLGKKD